MSSSSQLGHERFGIGTLFGRMDDAVLVIDVGAQRIVLCNPAAERLFGYSNEEMAGMPLVDIVPAGFPGHSAGRFEAVGCGKGGAAVWVEFSVSPIEGIGVPGMFKLAIGRDSGERKRFEAALEASEARFRAFMDVGPAVASMRDETGTYVYTNAQHRRLFGTAEWIGTTAHDHFPPAVAAQVLADDQVVLQRDEPAHFEEQLPGPDGMLTLMMFKFPFHDSSGQRLVGSLGIDITGLKRAQAELMERTKDLELANEALRLADSYKDEFLSVLSHELRTPITTIVGFTELLEDGAVGPLSTDQAEVVAQVERATRRLLGLVNDLIDFAQLQAGAFPLHLQRADVVGAVREKAESFAPRAKAAGIAFEVITPPAPMWGTIDARQVGRVVANLVDNALRFSPPGSRVTVRAAVQGHALLTEVVDGGIGIAAEHVPKLFDRFWQYDTSSTRTGGGLGLGLPIAKAIVDQHGGAIGARSEPGRGSTFWFTLPLEAPGR